MANYPKVDYKKMGRSLTGDVKDTYRSPGKDYGPDMTPNPYEYGVGQAVEGGAFENKYSGQNAALASKLMSLGDRDWSGEINTLAQKGIDRQVRDQNTRLGSLGMSELGLAGDIQDDWAERRTDAATRSKIQGAEMQRAGLATAVTGIQSMSGQDLDRSMAKVSALLGGGSQWLQYQRILQPLMEKMGGQDGSDKFVSPRMTVKMSGGRK